MRTGLLYRMRSKKTLLFMIAPAVIYFLLFSYVPMAGIVLAFKQYRYDLGIMGHHGWDLITSNSSS